jgi:hypothetical protein
MPVHDWTQVAAGIFHDFHHEWISTIKRALNDGLLPANYYALAEQVAGGLGPDVLTLETNLPSAESSDEPAAGGTAVAVAAPKVRFASVEDLDVSKRKRIVVRHVSGHRAVAIIELVSPGNKSTQHAVDRFVSKACELLEAGVHLMIVDLFPATASAPGGLQNAIWGEYSSESFDPPAEQSVTIASYSADPPKHAFAEAVAPGQSLPDMPLYLRHGRFVQVPLEATYESAFAAVPKFWRDRLQPA